MNVRDLFVRAVETWPDRAAVATGDVRLTFEQAWMRGLRLANLLLEHSVRAGDRVAVLEDNSLEAADFYLACMAANFVRVPLYARNAPESHLHMVNNTGCVAVVVAADHADEISPVRDRMTTVKYVLVRDDTYETQLSASPADDPTPIVGPDDYYIIRHTAGTTGRSKGVGYTHWKWLAYCRDWMFQFPNVDVGDTNLCASPISHGSGYFFTPVWIGGGRNYMIEKIVAEQTVDIMESERVTYMWCVPTLLGMLSRVDGVGDRDWTHLKGLLVGGAPITETTLLAGRAAFGDRIYGCYGQTEINPITTMTPQQWFADVPGSQPLRSAGRPYTFGMVKILDPDTGARVAPGMPGEIVAQLDGQLLGYWDDPEGSEAKIRDGWVHTGDIGRIDANGYLYLLDRAGDVVVSGGFNIYPAELENVIAAHPDVIEVAVFAVPDETWGESPAAVVVVDDGAAITEQDVIELCSERLGSYKRPRTVVLQRDPLPKSAVGKVLRRSLREPFWAGRDGRVAGS
jgi:acyl-CoA synthetase (AMP-forming)/AMP-acid ligase II